MATNDPFYPHPHDHAACIQHALQTASALCKARGLRFTPIRQRVLELVWSSHAPVAAYDLLRQLKREKANAEAPTVYRALDFLLEHSLVHKIESLNAFVGCNHPEEKHVSQFLICTRCRQVVEQGNPDIDQAIGEQAHRLDFKISHQTIEIEGVCASCRR